MSRALLAVAACAFAVALVGARATEASVDRARGPAHAHYELALRWDDASSTLAGTETVSFENARRARLRSVWLRLWGNGLGSCGHRLIRMRVVAGGSQGRRAAACTAREVVLAHPISRGKRARIELRFTERVPAGTERFGRQSGGPALLGNAVPILTVTDAEGTHLEPYSPLGEAGYSLASSWDVSLDLPASVGAATTGVQSHAQDLSPSLRRLRFAATRARDFELAIGPMHTHETTAGDVRIHLHDMLPAGAVARSLRAKVLDAARSDVLGYEQRFGRYGARELDIVQTPSLEGEGMEYPQIVFVEMSPATIGAESWRHFEGLLAHEIAHQWFYGIIGDNQWREPWLDESFATFASGFPSQHCTRGDPLAGFPTDVRLTSTMGFFDHHPARDYYGGLYAGGACALRDLRAAFGNSRFASFLRRWVDDHRFGVVTTRGFVSAIRRAAPPGFDVGRFLRRSRIDSGRT